VFRDEPDLAALFGSHDDAPLELNFLSQYKNLLHHDVHQTAQVHQTARDEASIFCGACDAVRRDIFLALGRFGERYRHPLIEAIELGYRLTRAGHRIRLCQTFFTTYTEKVGGITCFELRAEWAAQRIKDLSLKTVLLRMFMRPKRTIKSLIQEFEYPRPGPGMMWSAVKEEIERRVGVVRLNCDVVKIHRTGTRLDSMVFGRLARLNAAVYGVVAGIVAGLGVFIATNWLVLKGGKAVGPNLSLLGQFSIGYRVMFIGSLIGFAYAFVCGFVAGHFVTRIYNWLLDIKEGNRGILPPAPRRK